MNPSENTNQGCGGSGSCACAAKASNANEFNHAVLASINGVALHTAAQSPDEEVLRELAYTELLRQQAVKAGLLPFKGVLLSPDLTEEERHILESMVDAAVQVPEPEEEECRRYYEGRKSNYMVGQAVQLRHILFAVTPGVNVHALTVHAEKALISLLGKDVQVDAFAKLAAEMSNCPSSTQGGDLGWIGPDDCAPELANELFFQTDSLAGMGVHPRLVHTRFGFHIIDVLSRRKGRLLAYDEVRDRVVAQLIMQSRAKALHQYMSLLAGQALVEGIMLDTADSPLVQ